MEPAVLLRKHVEGMAEVLPDIEVLAAEDPLNEEGLILLVLLLEEVVLAVLAVEQQTGHYHQSILYQDAVLDLDLVVVQGQLQDPMELVRYLLQ